MENYTLMLIQTVILVALPVVAFFIVVEIVTFFKENYSEESAKFARNTIYNHAQTKGITMAGKMSHQKHSCGASNIASGVLSEVEHKTEATVGSKTKKQPFGFTYLPQTRLHGSGWSTL